MSEQQQLDPALIGAIAAGVASALGHQKAAGSTPNAIYAHGPGGLMSQPGMNPDVASALILPRGLGETLPMMRSVNTNEIFAIMTGQTAGSGTEPTTACGDATQPGNLKLCRQTYPWGRIVKESKVIQLDRVGEVINRGEFLDYRFINNPLAPGGDDPLSVNPSRALNSEYEKQLMELLVDIRRAYARLVYTGNPANTAGSEGYIEYFGLDYLINTGYRDAISGDACAAADSLVRAQNGLNVRTSAATAVAEIVETVAAINKRAEQVGATVDLALVMRYGLFRALTEVWPCVYASYRCTPGSGSTNFIDASMQMEMRDSMRRGNYLLIDGREVPVVIDDAITESTPVAGTQESDIYVIPLRVNGRPATYWQYFDLNNPFLLEAARQAAPADTYRVLGQGRYLMYKKSPTNVCVQFGLLWKPRLILEFPFLAARLTDFRYTSLIHEREWDPADPYYFVNGGVYDMTNYNQYFYPPRNS